MAHDDIVLGNSGAPVDAPGGLKVNGTTVVTSTGAVTADIQATAGSISRTELSTAAASKAVYLESATIATTGTVDKSFLVSEAGTLTSVDFSGVDALAANDTNYITWTVTNLGQAGAGTTEMLATTNTKVTGGAAISANTKRSFTLAAAANLVVAAGDLIRVRAAVTGTLANQVTIPKYVLRFGGTT